MAKYGPEPLAEEDKRLLVTLSISNKGYPRLKRLRAALEARQGQTPTEQELRDAALFLAYQAIDAYCEQAERDQETLII